MAFKKSLAFVSAAAVAFSAIAPAATFAASPFLGSAEALVAANVIGKQSSEAGYRLSDKITRAEVAKVASLAAKLDVSATSTSFNDVSSDFAGYVAALVKAGAVNGSAVSFRSNANITRFEALKILVKAFGISVSSASTNNFADVKAGTEVNDVVEVALAKGLISKNVSFRPNDSITRGEFFKIAAGALAMNTADNGSEDLGDLLSGLFGNSGSTSTSGSTGTVTTPVVVNGDLQVSLNNGSVGNVSIPNSGVVTFAKFDFAAGSKADASINTVKLSRVGLGNRSDIDRLWFEKNGVRISGRATVGSDGFAYVSFSPALVVKAGSVETADLVVSLGTNGATTSSAGQHAFKIASAADITASAAVSGTFPIQTATLSTSSYTVAAVTFATGGSAATYQVGSTNAELGNFKITYTNSDDKNVVAKSVVLKNDGSGDLKNVSSVALYRNGSKVSSATTVDGKYVTFTLADTLKNGDTATYSIRGNIDAVENQSGDTYVLTFKYAEDLNVSEVSTGFKASVSGANVSLATYTVNGGDVILSKSSAQPSSQTVAAGATDVVVLAADLKVSQPITLEDLVVTVDGATTGSGLLAFSSLKLVINGSTVSTYTPSTAAPATFTFDGASTISANSSVKILGNVKASQTAAAAVKLTFAATAWSTQEYVSNGNTIPDASMVGSAQGATITVGSAGLTLTRNDGISNQNIVVGSQNIVVGQFIARASDVSDLTITNLKFNNGTSGTPVANSLVSSVKLVVNGSDVSTKSLSSGNADFNDVQVKVLKNADVTVKLVASFDNAITTNNKFKLNLVSGKFVDVNGKENDITTALVGPEYTFQAAGTAQVALNSSTPNKSLLVPGSNEVELARFTLGATDDSLKLTDLYVYNAGTADLAARIKTVSLYDVNGAKLAGGSVVGTGTIAFALGSNSSFVIPKNTTNSTVSVKAAFNDITAAADDAKTVTLAVGTGSYTGTVVSGTVAGLRLVSESTGNSVTSVTGTATANAHLLVRSKPTVAASATGEYSKHTFTVTADANNRIYLTGLTFTTNNTSTGITAIVYKDSENTGNEVATGVTFTDGSISFPTSLVGSGVEVSAGTTKTFVVILSGVSSSTNGNATRTFKVTDVSYVDDMDANSTDVSVSNIGSYTNVGLPTSEQRATY